MFLNTFGAVLESWDDMAIGASFRKFLKNLITMHPDSALKEVAHMRVLTYDFKIFVNNAYEAWDLLEQILVSQ